MKKITGILAALLLSACASQPTFENTTAADYNMQLGLAYLAQDDYPRAKQKLLRATEQAPKTAEPYLALAYYYQHVGDLALAQQAYLQALAIAPSDGQANNNYGAFLCAQGDYSQAFNYFERAIADIDYPQTASAYENTALCYAQTGDYPRAKHYADLAVQHDPTRQLLLTKLELLKQNNSTIISTQPEKS